MLSRPLEKLSIFLRSIENGTWVAALSCLSPCDLTSTDQPPFTDRGGKSVYAIEAEYKCCLSRTDALFPLPNFPQHVRVLVFFESATIPSPHSFGVASLSTDNASSADVDFCIRPPWELSFLGLPRDRRWPPRDSTDCPSTLGVDGEGSQSGTVNCLCGVLG